MIAALSRLLQESRAPLKVPYTDESNVEIVLKHMLTGLVISLGEDKITLESFIEALKKADAENASNEKIKKRLDLFLNKAAVRLTKDLARDLKLLKLFWQSA